VVTFNEIMGVGKVMKDRDKVSELTPKKRSYYATGTDEKGRSFLNTDLSGKVYEAKAEAKRWASTNKLKLDGVFGLKK
jgi:hypothetical protein